MNTVNRRPRLVETPTSKAIATSYFHQNEWKGICEDKNTFGVDQNTFAECENVYVNRDNFLCNRPGLNDELLDNFNSDNYNGYKIYSTKSYIIYYGTNSKIIDVKQSLIETHDLTFPEGFNETDLYFYEIGNILFAFGTYGLYKLSFNSLGYKLEFALDNIYVPYVNDIKNLLMPDSYRQLAENITAANYDSLVLNKNLYESPFLQITKQNTGNGISFPYDIEYLKYILLYDTSLTTNLFDSLNANMNDSTFIISEGYPYFVTYSTSYSIYTTYTSLTVKFNSFNETLYPSKTFTKSQIHTLFPDITDVAKWNDYSVRLIDINKLNGELYFVFSGKSVGVHGDVGYNSFYVSCIVKCDISAIHSSPQNDNIFSAGKAISHGIITLLFDKNNNAYNLVMNTENNQVVLYPGFSSVGELFIQILSGSQVLDYWNTCIKLSISGMVETYQRNGLTKYKLCFKVYGLATWQSCYAILNDDGKVRAYGYGSNDRRNKPSSLAYFYTNESYALSGSDDISLMKKNSLTDMSGSDAIINNNSITYDLILNTGAYSGTSEEGIRLSNKIFIKNNNFFTRQFVQDTLYYPLVSPLNSNVIYDIFVDGNDVWFFTNTGIYIYTTTPSSIINSIIYHNDGDNDAKYSLAFINDGTYNNDIYPTLIRPIASNSFLYFVNDTSYILQVLYNNENIQLYIPEGKENKYYDTVIDAEQTSDKSLVVIGNNVLYSVVDTGEVDDKQLPLLQYIQSKLNLRVIEDSDSIIAYNSSTLLMPTYNGIAAVNYSQLISVEEQTVNYITDNVLSHWFRFIATETGRLKTCNHNYYLLVYHTGRNDLYMFDYRTNTWWYWTFDKNIKLLHTIGLYCFIVFEDNALHYFDEKVLDAHWSVTSQKLYLGNNTNYKQIRRFTVHTVGEHSSFPRLENADNIMDLRFYCYRKRMHSIQELEDRDDVYNFNVDFVRTYVIRLNYPKVYEFQYKLSSNKTNLKPLNLTGITIEYKIGGKVR